MIDDLMKNLQGGAVGDLMKKFNLDEGKAKGIFSNIGESTKEVMSKQVAGGGLDTVMNLFSNKTNGNKENGLQSTLSDNLIGKITSSLGVDSGMAKKITDSVLPSLMKSITSKNEETPSSDSSAIMNMFSGKGVDGIKDSITSKLGGLF